MATKMLKGILTSVRVFCMRTGAVISISCLASFTPEMYLDGNFNNPMCLQTSISYSICSGVHRGGGERCSVAIPISL